MVVQSIWLLLVLQEHYKHFPLVKTNITDESKSKIWLNGKMRDFGTYEKIKIKNVHVHDLSGKNIPYFDSDQA